MDNLIVEQLPLLALRGIVVFPGVTSHFDVSREKSVRAVQHAMKTNQRIYVVMQKDIMEEDPSIENTCAVGTACYVQQMMKAPGGVIRVLLVGQYRAHVLEDCSAKNCPAALVEEVPDAPYERTPESDALIRHCYDLFKTYAEMENFAHHDTLLSLLATANPGEIADIITQASSFDYPDKQRILEEQDPIQRMKTVSELLEHELQVIALENDLETKVQENMETHQRDYYLREQLNVIKSELGEDSEENELKEYQDKILALHLSEETEQKLLKEVSRLGKQPFGSSEAAVIRNYLDLCLELPWNTRTEETIDLEKARRILDKDHFGLQKVKERILEILAVKKLSPNYSGQILCLVGPPGVGKTSVAISVARCLNRKLSRISLGGVHDEADIRGHRKTYIGAMPGRIMEGVRQAGSKNALLVLDEIDKMGTDYRGDPSSALLEVLDSEQNYAFRDHFIEVPFDLSECLFITTANTTDTIPAALLDRMEVIELNSYTDEEKLVIAKKHLLPKLIEKHGLKRSQISLSDTVIRSIISEYTRESGVRNLNRELASVCRKVAIRLVSDESVHKVTVKKTDLESYLGVRKYEEEHRPANDQVGLVTGLAWTSVGGTVLEVEANAVPGTGKLILTGNLGKVMEESAQAALSYIRSRADELQLPVDFHEKQDIHIHFPEGAVPKDGPSAGITICTAMISALTGRAVRKDIAMTGEISIRGRVLPIGGLKEKTMAALRYGVHTVIIPKENEKDLNEIDQMVRSALEFIPVSHYDEVRKVAFTDSPDNA